MTGVYLPEHVIYQIFLRMPTRPLTRFKCLSKHWNRVISDPNFIKSRSRRMIFLPILPFHAMDSLDKSVFKLCSPLINPKHYKGVTVVGSFNGIVLLVLKYNTSVVDCNKYYTSHMILYNPLLGKFETVPDSPSFNSDYNCVYGFGYGTTTDDLKIVKLKNYYYEKSTYCEVFSLKAWSWGAASKVIGDYDFSTSYSGTFANGLLYWIANRRTNSCSLIVALNMKNMVFSHIEIQDEFVLHRLGTCNDRLCIICFCGNGKGYELRVMNEYELEKSWSVYSFGSSIRPLIFGGPYVNLLGTLDDGKLLTLESEKQLVIHDMFEDSYKEVNALTGFSQPWKLQSVEYVESLIYLSDICSV